LKRKEKTKIKIGNCQFSAKPTKKTKMSDNESNLSVYSIASQDSETNAFNDIFQSLPPKQKTPTQKKPRRRLDSDEEYAQLEPRKKNKLGSIKSISSRRNSQSESTRIINDNLSSRRSTTESENPAGLHDFTSIGSMGNSSSHNGESKTLSTLPGLVSRYQDDDVFTPEDVELEPFSIEIYESDSSRRGNLRYYVTCINKRIISYNNHQPDMDHPAQFDDKEALDQMIQNMITIMYKLTVEQYKEWMAAKKSLQFFALRLFQFVDGDDEFPESLKDDLTIEAIHDSRKFITQTFEDLQFMAEKERLCGKREIWSTNISRQNCDMFHQTFKILTCAAESLKLFCHTFDLLDIESDKKMSKPEEMYIKFMAGFDSGDIPLSELQTLLIYLFRKAAERGFRKYKDTCWKQIRYKGESGKENIATHAWVYAMDIPDFVNECVSRNHNFTQWLLMSSHTGYYKHCKDILQAYDDYQFPRLKPNRYLFSFQNGIYNLETDTFKPYDDPELTPDIVSCKYFNMKFEDSEYRSMENWFDYPTPHFDGIFEYQGIPAEVIRWIYILVGRMFYPVGEHDDWQVSLFLKGQAGTGKSTLLQLIKKFFHDMDVGILSNNIEKKFGLETLFDKFIVLCYEVKSNFQLEQSDLQTMISGEDITVARKNRVPIMTKWAPPMMFAGNELGPWIDASGSMARRFIITEFLKRVKEADNDLKKKLELELPALMYKFNNAYRQAIRDYGKKGIWTPGLLPAYFGKTQETMRKTTNSIVSFLADSDTIVLGAQFYMPLAVLASSYKQYCQTFGLKEIGFTPDAIDAPFELYALRREHCKRVWNDKMEEQMYVFGVKPSSKSSTLQIDEE